MSSFFTFGNEQYIFVSSRFGSFLRGCCRSGIRRGHEESLEMEKRKRINIAPAHLSKVGEG